MPEWRAAIDARLAALGVAPVRRVDIIAEVAHHLQDRYEELLAAGHTAGDAQRLALADLETDRLIAELARIERTTVLDPPVLGTTRQAIMSTLWQDLRYALRSMRAAPAYTIVVIATLALGIGANAAIFSVADAVMIRPYAYPDIDRLVAMGEMHRGGGEMSIAWPNFQDWLTMNQSFEHIGLYHNVLVSLTGSGQAEGLNGAIASSGVFETMGVPAIAGRMFNADDDKPDAANVAVISERLWRSHFDADPSAVGRTVLLNNEPHVIVGVMADGMRFPSRLTDVWLALGPAIQTFPKMRGAHPGLFAIARLKPGVTYERAVADMDTVARRLETQYPDTNRNNGIQVTRYYEQIVENIRPTLYVLLGAVGFVLLIGCANLANLMLARAERRQREIAVRAALGAERRRIVQQLLTESLTLAAIGGALGVLLAWWGVSVFVASHPTSIPRIDLVGIDWRVVAFSAALAMITGTLFGLVPALRASKPDLVATLKQTSGAGGGARRLRSVLVIAEVALAVVLLVGAGLMIRSFARLMAIDTGFNPDGVVTMRVRVPLAKYRDLDKWTAFHEDLVRRVATIPGVTAAAVNSAVPLEGGGSEAPVIAEGQPLPTPETRPAVCLFQVITPDYLKTMGIAVVRGRAFSDMDTRSASRVVIVDEALVHRLYPTGDPIGRHIAFEFAPAPGGNGHGGAHGAATWREIVGVVRHVRHYGIASEPPFVQVYTPIEQPPLWFVGRRPVMALFAHTSLNAEVLTKAVRTEMASIDPDVPVAGVQTMKDYFAQNTERPRLNVIVLAGLGVLALGLAVIGIYGVVSYSVAQRTREIGVRMALGATRRDVLGAVVGHAVALIGLGVAIGVGAALALSGLVRSLLYQVSPQDPLTIASIAALLIAVGVLASVVPARRATRVDPLSALRAE